MGMKRVVIFLIIILLLALLAYFYPNLTGKASSLPNNSNFEKEPAFVNRVIDGDTIVVSGSEIGNQTHIRLLGINNPKGMNL